MNFKVLKVVSSIFDLKILKKISSPSKVTTMRTNFQKVGSCRKVKEREGVRVRVGVCLCVCERERV